MLARATSTSAWTPALAEDDQYATLVGELRAQGYAPYEGGRYFQMVRTIHPQDGGPAVDVIVDFLRPYDAVLEKNRPALTTEFATQRAYGVDLATRFYQSVAIEGDMPRGGTNRVMLAVASIPALLAMKGYALAGRLKRKDAYDVYYSVRNYPGGIEALAEDCRPVLAHKSGQEGYAHLDAKFDSPDRFGPTSVWQFVEGSDAADDRSADEWRQDAFGRSGRSVCGFRFPTSVARSCDHPATGTRLPAGAFGLTEPVKLLSSCSEPGELAMEPTRRGLLITAASAVCASGVARALDTPDFVEPTKLIVKADGHPLTLWCKRPRAPRGAILLVHGRTWSSRPNFDLHDGRRSYSIMDALRARGHAAYALDLRGYGATPRDATGWLTPTRAAADVLAALKHVAEREPGLPKPVLVGYSRGAVVSLLSAQTKSADVSALVLYGIGYDVGAKPKPQLEAPRPLRQSTTAQAAASDFITPEITSPEVVQAYVAEALRRDPVRSDWRREHEFGVLDPATVRTPTLLLHGARDPYVKMDAQSRLFTTLGTERKVWAVLAGADHAAHLKTTQADWIEAIGNFVE